MLSAWNWRVERLELGLELACCKRGTGLELAWNWRVASLELGVELDWNWRGTGVLQPWNWAWNWPVASTFVQ